MLVYRCAFLFKWGSVKGVFAGRQCGDENVVAGVVWREGAVFVQKRSVLLSVAIVRVGGNAESGRCGAAEGGGNERMRR